MTRGRPKADSVITDDERTQLTSFARSRSLPTSLSARARIILSSAEGQANSSIAERLGLGKATVGTWRARFIERRVAGLYDDVRPGPPRTTDDERVAGLINDQDHGAHQAGQGLDALERALGGRRDRHLQEQRAALLPTLRVAAASLGELQAVQRSVLRFFEKLRDLRGCAGFQDFVPLRTP